MARRWVIAAHLVLSACAFAQKPALSARDALDALYKEYQGKLPNCLDVSQAREAAEDDVTWLSQRLAQTGWSNVQPEYGESLNELVYTVRAASASRDVRTACETVLAVMRDMHIKRIDCRELGHSRTKIQVEIEVKQGRSPLADWEVYTRWLPAGDRVSTVPLRLEALSTPAHGKVPTPGEYEIFAKSPSGLSTKPERVSIGGTGVFKWQLQVPSSLPQPAKR